MADPIPSSDKRFGLKELERHARIPLERIEFYSDPDPLLIAEIECGVLLVMAFWSASSYQAFTRLTETLHRLDPGGRLRLVVVDTDRLGPTILEHPALRGQQYGSGEVAWIKNGQIQATTICGATADLDSQTLTLLESIRP